MIIPAIDLIDGRIVRLYQGDYAKTTQYELTPHALRDQYASAGAALLHVVDLSGAKDASQRQLPLLRSLMQQSPLPVQVGGGVRSERDVDDLLEAGASRVVIGSLAIREPALVASWLTRYGGERIVLALDVAISADGRKTLPSHGWIAQSDITLEHILAQLLPAGARHVLCTDISKDGTLQGPNVPLYQALHQAYPQIAWQASGGVGRLDDIRALRGAAPLPSPVAGVILGRALLEGKFSIEEALTCWQNG